MNTDGRARTLAAPGGAPFPGAEVFAQHPQANASSGSNLSFFHTAFAFGCWAKTAAKVRAIPSLLIRENPRPK